MERNIEKLIQSFASALNVDSVNITDDLKYQGIPEWDSVSHMILISEIEDAFEIAMETDDVIALSSLSEAKRILTKYSIEF